jgi:hypothetical protein
LPKGLAKEDPGIENPGNLWKIINGRIEANPKIEHKTVWDMLPNNPLSIRLALPLLSIKIIYLQFKESDRILF